MTFVSQNRRACRLALLFAPLLALLTLAQGARAEHEIASGVPVVEEPGILLIGGQKIQLWGIDTLAPDQRCWQGKDSWSCGEESVSVLRHFVQGRQVECRILQKPDASPLVAQCFRKKGAERRDIAHFLVSHGWAMDRGEASGGAYFEAENEAQEDKRGIWSSKFQTPEDWRLGIQRFVGEEEEGAESESPAPQPEEGP